MKQIFLTLLLFFPLSLMAQEESSYEYQSFVAEGKTWHVHYYTTYYTHGLSSTALDWTFYISGDTIINNQNFKKLMVTAEEDVMSTFFKGMKREGDAYLYGCLFEEDKKVYSYNPYNSNYKLYLLYDWGMKEGDKQEDTYIVGSVDTIDFYGVKRRVMHIYGYGGIEEHWVEGIGTRCPFGPGYSTRTGAGWDLVDCVVNNNIVFTGDFYGWNGETNGIKDPFEQSIKRNDDIICDLQGRCVTAPQKGGLYIKNGRKILWK